MSGRDDRSLAGSPLAQYWSDSPREIRLTLFPRHILDPKTGTTEAAIPCLLVEVGRSPAARPEGTHRGSFTRYVDGLCRLSRQLYLHGLAQGDFELALRDLLGEGAPLSPASIVRLRGKWQLEYEAWCRRSLDAEPVVYCVGGWDLCEGGARAGEGGAAGGDRGVFEISNRTSMRPLPRP